MSVLECPKPNVDDVAVPRRYVIDDHIAVKVPAPPNRTLDVWVPLIPDLPSQRILDLSVRASCEWSVTREATFGNQMVHVRTADAPRWPLEVGLRYQVERLSVAHALHPAVGTAGAR